MKARFVIVCGVALMALQGCGGGGGDGGTTPTPAPTPTPTPTPAPTYDLASDFARDRSFNAIGLIVTAAKNTTTTELGSTVESERSTIGFDFVASSRTYQARYGDARITATTTATATTPPGDVFEGPNSRFARQSVAIGPTSSSSEIATRYLGFALWTDNNGSGAADPGTRANERILLFGARTVQSDVPATGTRTLTGTAPVGGTAGFYGQADSTTATVDYAAKTVTVTTSFRPGATAIAKPAGTPPPAQSITLSGTLDPISGRMSGTATDNTTGGKGLFEGALYGPKGVEAGFLFSIFDGGAQAVIRGVVAARE